MSIFTLSAQVNAAETKTSTLSPQQQKAQKLALTYQQNKTQNIVKSVHESDIPYGLRTEIINDPETGKPLVWHYRLRPNDSFTRIEAHLLDRKYVWRDLLRFNNIDDPAKVKTGTLISIPVTWLKHQPIPANALSVTGTVLLRKQLKQNLTRLQSNTPIEVGDEIITKVGSVLVQFADDSVIRINENSQIIFNQLTAFGQTGMTDTRIRLERGDISTRVMPLEPGSRYEIETPSAVAAVRGTAFRLHASPNQTRLEVTKGTVAFTPSAQSSMRPKLVTSLIKKDTGAIITQGIPIEKVELPVTLTALQPNFQAEHFPITLQWQSNPLLKRSNKNEKPNLFHYQLYNASINGQILNDIYVSKASINLNELENGHYVAIMRAVDKKGFEGPDASIRLTIDLRAVPSILNTPTDKQIINIDKALFSWTAQQPNELSRLEFALDANFEKLVQTTDYTGKSQITLTRPPSPGNYYWRVRSQVGGNSVAISEARAVTLKSQLKFPTILATHYENNQVRLLWLTDPEAKTYLLQIALDSSFENVIKEKTVTRSTATVTLDKGKVYYARVKTIGSDFWLSSIGDYKQISLK